jgi:hypothetical protein
MATDPASVKDLYHALCGDRYCLECAKQNVSNCIDCADRTMGKADAFLPTDGFDVDVDDCATVSYADAI